MACSAGWRLWVSVERALEEEVAWTGALPMRERARSARAGVGVGAKCWRAGACIAQRAVWLLFMDRGRRLHFPATDAKAALCLIHHRRHQCEGFIPRYIL